MPVMRTAVSIVGLSIGLISTGWAEPAARELISPDAALVLEISRPLQIIDNPLGRDVWELLRETNGVKQALSSPEFEKFRQVGKFIEKSLGVDWQTGIGRLTAGGIVVSIGQKP